MEAKTTPKVKADAGGYKDRLWIPRFWSGIHFTGWLRILARNRFRIHPFRIVMATIILLLGAFNSCLAILQRLRLGRKIDATKIEQQPIFIVGHWRSGTTLLHEFLVLDPRHYYADTYACFCPHHFLISRWILPRMIGFLMPTRRPMDNMAAGWDRPQEDEFALCNLGIPSPYLTQVFPNEPPQYPEYLTLDVPPQELARWKRAFVWFLQCLTLQNPKRIVLKSPPHTARLKTLLELFPQAKFIHIYRDPFVVFPSTVNLWKRLYEDEGLQSPTYRGLEEHVFETFERMYAAFERDRLLAGPAQLAEVSYEALVADPMGEVRRLYEELELGGFDELAPALKEFVAGQKDYQKNRYQIAPEIRSEIARRWAGYIEKYGYADKVAEA
jgi:hypothetical protein